MLLFKEDWQIINVIITCLTNEPVYQWNVPTGVFEHLKIFFSSPTVANTWCLMSVSDYFEGEMSCICVNEQNYSLNNTTFFSLSVSTEQTDICQPLKSVMRRYKHRKLIQKSVVQECWKQSCLNKNKLCWWVGMHYFKLLLVQTQDTVPPICSIFLLICMVCVVF